jgi:hypothetical protein
MMVLDKRLFEATTPQATTPQPQPPSRGSGALAFDRERERERGATAEEEPRSTSYASRRRPIAPDFYSEPEEPLADSVRRAAEEHPDLTVANASPISSTSR